MCRTIDVSEDGISLDTAAWFPLGTRLSIAFIDPHGQPIELIGDVIREAGPPTWSLGVALVDPPREWKAVVASASRQTSRLFTKPNKRMRVLVFGDDHRQRGAMALYVTSGWDVLFVTDEGAISEALSNIEVDAVVAELDVSDPRLLPLMDSVRASQPGARRIVVGNGEGQSELVHRFVDRDAGMHALLDAVSADMPQVASAR